MMTNKLYIFLRQNKTVLETDVPHTTQRFLSSQIIKLFQLKSIFHVYLFTSLLCSQVISWSLMQTQNYSGTLYTHTDS